MINILYRLYTPERCMTCFDALSAGAEPTDAQRAHVAQRRMPETDARGIAIVQPAPTLPFAVLWDHAVVGIVDPNDSRTSGRVRLKLR